MSVDYTSRISRRAMLKGTAGAAAALAVPTFFVKESYAATRTLRIGIIPAYAFGIYWLVQDQGFAPGVNSASACSGCCAT